MPPELRVFDGSPLSLSPAPILGPAPGSTAGGGPVRARGRHRRHPHPGDPAAIDRLRTMVHRIEGGRAPERDGPVLALGIAAIDDHLPWGGLLTGALHEVVALDAGMASAFCALLCARLAQGGGEGSGGEGSGGMVLWCEGASVLDAGALHAPGLRRFGLDPARLILARTGHDAETLWAVEEGLRSAPLAVVVGAVADVSLTQTRRLQLAAQSHGVPALMLRPAAAGRSASAAMTRWRIGPVPGKPVPGKGVPGKMVPAGDFTAGLAPLRWRMELFRCRGGTPGTWDVEWCDETRDLTLAAPLRDRPAAPALIRAAG